MKKKKVITNKDMITRNKQAMLLLSLISKEPKIIVLLLWILLNNTRKRLRTFVLSEHYLDERHLMALVK